ncbi:hypothetical protein D3C73_1108900 [compost metagenome]
MPAEQLSHLQSAPVPGLAQNLLGSPVNKGHPAEFIVGHNSVLNHIQRLFKQILGVEHLLHRELQPLARRHNLTGIPVKNAAGFGIHKIKSGQNLYDRADIYHPWANVNNMLHTSRGQMGFPGCDGLQYASVLQQAGITGNQVHMTQPKLV